MHYIVAYIKIIMRVTSHTYLIKDILFHRSVFYKRNKFGIKFSLGLHEERKMTDIILRIVAWHVFKLGLIVISNHHIKQNLATRLLAHNLYYLCGMLSLTTRM